MSATHLIGRAFALSFFAIIAFFINEIPTSSVLQSILPDWPFLIVLYLAVSIRWRTSVVFAFIVGLVQDHFIGTPLGVHAFSYTICSYVISQYRTRFPYTGMLFQTMIIGMLVFLKVLLILIVKSFMYALPGYFWNLLSIPLSMFAWVLLSWLGMIFERSEFN